MSKDREICGRALLNITIVVLKMCYQVRECEFSSCGGRLGVFLEGNTLRRECNSFKHSQPKVIFMTRHNVYIGL